ncbi:MAG: glycosyltransferase [Bacteroidota bacterium]
MKKPVAIYLTGPLPPPAGGISVHLQRLRDHLIAHGKEVTVYEDSALIHRSLRLSLKRLFGRSPRLITRQESMSGDKNGNVRYLNSIASLLSVIVSDKARQKRIIVHYHTKNWKYRALICLACALNADARSVFTIHSLRDEYRELPVMQRLCLKYALSRASFLIAVNERIADKLESWGGDRNKIAVIPAFLPPQDGNIGSLPAYVERFMGEREPVLSANASGLRIIAGKEIYGVRRTIELCARLKENFPRVGVVFCLSKIDDREYYEKMQGLIREYALEDNFLFVTEPCDFFPVLKKSDVFLRPTTTDGDALSVRESLYLGVPAVVSDAVERPSGSMVFDTDSQESLFLKTLECLENANDIPKSGYDYLSKILTVYESI